MMRIISPWRVSVLLACVLACIAAPEAGAQSLIQSLFGNMFKSSPPKQAPAAPPSVKVSPRQQNSNFALPNFEYRQPQKRQRSLGGAYRTVCVRRCDGYYFPISGSSSRRKFREDAEACSARCGGGKLYYLPKRSENMAAMVDLSGRRYDQMENAFVYRKKLINGCACRPMPWSAAERARHNRYAYAEEILRLNEERAKKRREAAIARAKERPAESASEEVAEGDRGPQSSRGSVAGVIDDSAGTTQTAEVAQQTGERVFHETTDSAYFAVVKAAISAGSRGGAQKNPQVEAEAQHVNYSPRRQTTVRTRKKTKTRRARKKKSKAMAANGWALGGGSKYTWPGDR